MAGSDLLKLDGQYLNVNESMHKAKSTMLNTLTLTPEQELEVRAKAFYLLKKWTSITFLEHAVALYRDFLCAYAKQLDTPDPRQEDWETQYNGEFLKALIRMDQGLESLSKGSDKRSAYCSLIADGQRISDLVFGRSADETGRKYEPFFYSLGVRDTNYTATVYATEWAEGVWIMELSCFALKCTAGLDFSGWLTHGKRVDGGSRIFKHWTYESLFQDAYHPAWRIWPPGRSYPEQLPACPPKNESSEGEIHSGREIPVEGIWEPWLPDGKVGCPSYFLKGSIAHQYLLEGANDEHAVAWRLLWADERYQGGDIPADEDTYFPEPAVQAEIRALPGEPCSRSGYWQSPAMQDLAYVDAGEPMPGPRRSSRGMVIWYYCDSPPYN